MGRLFEELLVEQCAPTLTGLKPASLFRYQADDRIESVQAAVHWARELEPYGITVRVLKVCPKTGASLIYLYRKTELLRLLAEPAVLNFLKGSGYETEGGGDQLLRQLSRRLCLEEEFPMKSASFWATRWRMWRASSATGEEIFRSAATGRSMETRRRLRSSLRDTAAVRFTVWNSSEAAYPLSA